MLRRRKKTAQGT